MGLLNPGVNWYILKFLCHLKTLIVQWSCHWRIPDDEAIGSSTLGLKPGDQSKDWVSKCQQGIVLGTVQQKHSSCLCVLIMGHTRMWKWWNVSNIKFVFNWMWNLDSEKMLTKMHLGWMECETVEMNSDGKSSYLQHMLCVPQSSGARRLPGSLY